MLLVASLQAKGGQELDWQVVEHRVKEARAGKIAEGPSCTTQRNGYRPTTRCGIQDGKLHWHNQQFGKERMAGYCHQDEGCAIHLFSCAICHYFLKLSARSYGYSEEESNNYTMSHTFSATAALPRSEDGCVDQREFTIYDEGQAVLLSWMRLSACRHNCTLHALCISGYGRCCI